MLIQSEEYFVTQDKGCPASFLNPQHVTGTVGLV
jgi:hypothetical protein